ncbi:tetratricopeptide repeat protein [Actinoplanes sp. NPDC051346]|uniref:tetratricopeptide repeat protein n=1 Tax=Actinoplanes sp. NPDC051346 TaxID=3155048 RepID=UPI003415E0DE
MRRPLRHRRRWPWIVLGSVGLLAVVWNWLVSAVDSYRDAGLSERDQYSGVYSLPVAVVTLLIAVIGLAVQSRQGRRALESVSGPVPAPPAGMTSLDVPEATVGEQIRGRASLITELTGMYEREARNMVRVRVLHGMGGVGKTTIARHVGGVLRRRGILVWFVSAAEQADLDAGMRQLADSLGASRYELTDGWARAPDVLWRHLEAYSRRWLLIIDNADDLSLLAPHGHSLAQKRGWIRPVGTRRGAIIVTSRNGDAQTWGDWCRLHPVGMLSTADGAQVLLDLAGPDSGTRDQAAALATRLGGLPLALRLAGRYLADAHRRPALEGQITTFAGYRATLDAEGIAAVFPDPDGQLTDVHAREVIAHTWELSLTLLETRKSLPHARNLLRLLSVLADAPIPYQAILDASTMAASPLFSGLNTTRLASLLAGLETFGLLDLGPPEPGASATLRLHPLIRDTSLFHLHAAGQTPAVFDLAAQLLFRAADRHGAHGDPANWAFFRLFAPHPIHVLAQAAAAPGPRQEVISNVTQAASLVTEYRASIGLFTAAAAEGRTIRATAVQVLGDEHPDVLNSSADVASFTGGAGDEASARDQYAALIPTVERVLGPEHKDTLLYRSNLAWFTGQVGDAVAARDQCAGLLPLALKALGDEHFVTLFIRHSLARFTGEAGDATRARDQYLTLLPSMRRTLGPIYNLTLHAEQQLAIWTGKAGDTATARDQLTDLLPVLQRALGPEHHDTLSARSDLAYWTGRVGDPAAARDRFADLPARFQQALGPEHRKTLNARAHLAYWTGWAGNPAAARDQLTDLLPVLQRVLGPEHRDTLSARFDLARWTGRAGNPTAARDQLTDLLPVLQRVLGPEDQETLRTRVAFADLPHRA